MLHDFLVEIGCEELPPKALLSLSEAFRDGIAQELKSAALAYVSIESFATPRRLAVRVGGLVDKQEDQSIERRGPAYQAAFDAEGQPTKAAQGFARSCGVSVDELGTIESEKGKWLSYTLCEHGQQVSTLLPDIVKRAIHSLPIPKPMRWGSGSTEFVRPVHWLVMLLDESVIEAKLLGQTAGRLSYGHRFHHPESVSLSTPADYEALLNQAFVMVSFDERRARILSQIEPLAEAEQAQVILDDALLNEVTALVEWPRALQAGFSPEFLTVPAEALIAAMNGHQKSFAMASSAGELLPYFVTVSNIDVEDMSHVIKGNEKVMRARLSDAAFFYQQDCQSRLEESVAATQSVIFQQKLGSLYDKTERVAHLMEAIAPQLNLDPDQALRAAHLAKADLMTGMVGEFPELQGIMGYYYALNDDESEAVARALKEQYHPRFSGDILAETTLGNALALAERLDTLVGIFGINQQPTGVKDPFKCRRQALGLIRILTEQGFALRLDELLQRAVAGFGHSLENTDVLREVTHFILERLKAWYLEQGYSSGVITAVLASGTQHLADIQRRIEAVNDFLSQSEAEALAAANKRVSKLLQREQGDIVLPQVDHRLFESDVESRLAAAVSAKQEALEPLFENADYRGALSQLAELRDDVDGFFDEVMVMVDDESVRNNRLSLLANLRQLFLRVADISLL